MKPKENAFNVIQIVILVVVQDQTTVLHAVNLLSYTISPAFYHALTHSTTQAQHVKNALHHANHAHHLQTVQIAQPIITFNSFNVNQTATMVFIDLKVKSVDNVIAHV